MCQNEWTPVKDGTSLWTRGEIDVHQIVQSV